MLVVCDVVVGFHSPEEAVGWMESLCRAFPTNPKEAEAALTELRRSEHAVEVSKIILGKWRGGDAIRG